MIDRNPDRPDFVAGTFMQRLPDSRHPFRGGRLPVSSKKINQKRQTSADENRRKTINAKLKCPQPRSHAEFHSIGATVERWQDIFTSLRASNAGPDPEESPKWPPLSYSQAQKRTQPSRNPGQHGHLRKQGVRMVNEQTHEKSKWLVCLRWPRNAPVLNEMTRCAAEIYIHMGTRICMHPPCLTEPLAPPTTNKPITISLHAYARHHTSSMYIIQYAHAQDSPDSANLTPLNHHGIPDDVKHTLICMAARVGCVLALLLVISVFMWWRERRR
ncbi:hypothetical protein IWX90DRAFT_277040 [Phyllosticta citrichinensis]|uniref:Uncharacterized protein n=1 Tax=Phyllosticta citrichinensis TaxID=1130410 RepID=A0ABR1XN63_9PEZI